MIDKDKEEIKKKDFLGDKNQSNDYQLVIYRLYYINISFAQIYSSTQPVIHDVRDVKNAVSFWGKKSRANYRLLCLELKVTSNFVLV